MLTNEPSKVLPHYLYMFLSEMFNWMLELSTWNENKLLKCSLNPLESDMFPIEGTQTASNDTLGERPSA